MRTAILVVLSVLALTAFAKPGKNSEADAGSSADCNEGETWSDAGFCYIGSTDPLLSFVDSEIACGLIGSELCTIEQYIELADEIDTPCGIPFWAINSPKVTKNLFVTPIVGEISAFAVAEVCTASPSTTNAPGEVNFEIGLIPIGVNVGFVCCYTPSRSGSGRSGAGRK